MPTGAATASGRRTFLHSGSTPVDDFYTASADVPARPGQLVRSAPLTRGVPAGARARRILYTTTGRDDRAALAIAREPEQVVEILRYALAAPADAASGAAVT